MVNVGGGQPQSLDLAELPVQGLGGDQLPQAGEGRVDALGPVHPASAFWRPPGASLLMSVFLCGKE